MACRTGKFDGDDCAGQCRGFWRLVIFEMIGTSHDGMRSASERVEASAQLREDEFSKSSHHLRIVVGRGSPKTLLATEATEGPTWLVALDRNKDGSITKGEFPAYRDVFKKLDLNGDGAIDASEAAVSPMK